MAAGLAGIGLGWFLRFIISLGKRGSMELEIKEMMISAREEVEKIRREAEEEAHKIVDKVGKTEERLINKESYLDKRQIDLDSMSESLKNKEAKIGESTPT